MNGHRNAPDPEGLAIAWEIQKKLHPSEIILGGSRAAGDHRPDSDVDLGYSGETRSGEAVASCRGVRNLMTPEP